MTLLCTGKELVSQIIDKYRAKSGDQDMTEIFLFNANRVNPTLTLDEIGIKNNGYIEVIRRHIDYGA